MSASTTEKCKINLFAYVLDLSFNEHFFLKYFFFKVNLRKFVCVN